MSKITAIHGGGDWADASADYLIVPESVNIENEKILWRDWYHKVYCPSINTPNKLSYIGFVDWLKKLGAREPAKSELEIVEA